MVVSEKVFFINESFWVDDNRSVLSEDETMLLKKSCTNTPLFKNKSYVHKISRLQYSTEYDDSATWVT